MEKIMNKGTTKIAELHQVSTGNASMRELTMNEINEVSGGFSISDISEIIKEGPVADIGGGVIEIIEGGVIETIETIETIGSKIGDVFGW